MLFTVDVQYTGSIEHAQASPASSTEQPTCPVCLGMQVFVCVCGFIVLIFIQHLMSAFRWETK